MICPHCSAENTDDSKFCMSCGERLVPDPSGERTDDPMVPPPPTAETASNPWLSEGTDAQSVPPEPTASPLPSPPVAPSPPPVAPLPSPPVAPSPPVGTWSPAAPTEVDTEPVAPPDPPPDPADPHGLAAHLARMSEATRPHAELPVLLASMLLDAAERVGVVVPGLVDDIVGVAVVTDRRVLIVNGRRWNPSISEFPIQAGLTVEGWQEADSAMLTFSADRTVRVTSIVDKPLAFEVARQVRERVAASPG